MSFIERYSCHDREEVSVRTVLLELSGCVFYVLNCAAVVNV